MRISKGDAEVVVVGYPRLPERFRECTCGWIAGTAELTGVENPTVTKTDEDPMAWRFHLRWT